MESSNSKSLRYPIGTHSLVTCFDMAGVDKTIAGIEDFPARLRTWVEGFSDPDLEKRNRPGGWTIRQVVHHLHDSHLQNYTRFKWALTEDKPVIKAYFEERWAELPDYRLVPIELSLRGLEALHARWTASLRTMDKDAFKRSFVHPESGQEEFLFERAAM